MHTNGCFDLLRAAQMVLLLCMQLLAEHIVPLWCLWIGANVEQLTRINFRIAQIDSIARMHVVGFSYISRGVTVWAPALRCAKSAYIATAPAVHNFV